MVPWTCFSVSCHSLLLEMLQACEGHSPESSFTRFLLRSATACWLGRHTDLWKSLAGRKIKVTLKPQTMYRMYYGLEFAGFCSFFFFPCLLQLGAMVSRRVCCLDLKLLCGNTLFSKVLRVTEQLAGVLVGPREAGSLGDSGRAGPGLGAPGVRPSLGVGVGVGVGPAR